MAAFIKVEQVSLSVPIFVQRHRRVGGWAGMLFGAAFDPPRREFTQLLEDISFEAQEGDRVAILGRNGAGKSTLLRVLNGVYAPTRGQVRVSGTCQALLNISLGFNGEATVRENIFLRGTAMGIGATQLRQEIEPILEFAGLQHKAHHRLRTLSSGQRMRLGFSISTSFQHDIILMDEWMGAGDAEFMSRAKERMLSRVGGSKIVMLASHSVSLLRDVCNKGIVLEQGKLVHSGDIIDSLRAYHELMADLRGDAVTAMPTSGAVTASSIYGFVEQLDLSQGRLLVKGWFVNGEGKVPESMALEYDGSRYMAARVKPVQRPDVMRHLGLSDADCGFAAEFNLEAERLVDLGSDLRVLVGDGDRPDTPLSLGAAVTALLAGRA